MNRKNLFVAALVVLTWVLLLARPAPGGMPTAEARSAFEAAQQASMAGDAEAALEAVLKARDLAPDDVEILRGCAAIANWNEAYEQAIDCYRRIQAVQPNDHDASLGEARSTAWAGHTDHAVELYRRHVDRFPQDRDARLELARTEAWRGNTADARDVLDTYARDFGDCPHCRRELAFVLARERPREALGLLDNLLLEMPGDPLVQSSLPVALAAAGRPAKALDRLDLMDGAGAETDQIRDVARWVTTPLRSRVTPLVDLYGDSDSVRRQRAGMDIELALRPALRLDASVVDTRLDADLGSGLEASGGRQLRLRSWWLGAAGRPVPWLRLDGRFGIAELQTATSETYSRGDLDLWSLGADLDLGDSVRLGLRHGREFYDVSPRALDLGIYRTESEVQLTVRPGLRTVIDAEFRYAELSDGNTLRSWIVAPRRVVLRREHWNLDLGLRARRLSFDLDLGHGYYDPADYRRYDLTAFVYWKITDDHGLSIHLAAGPYRDETATTTSWQDHDWAADIDLELSLGIFDDWMLRLRGAHSVNDRTATGAFDATSFTVALTRRF